MKGLGTRSKKPLVRDGRGTGDVSRGEGHDLMAKERWGMVSKHLKTKDVDARSSRDNEEQGEG